MTKKRLGLLLLGCGLLLSGCSDGGSGQADRLLLGAVYAADLDDLVQSELNAVQLAVEEANQAGIFEKSVEVINLSPTNVDFVDPLRAADNVKLLYDDIGALAFFSGHALDTVYHMVEVTNLPAYSDFVQCNDGALEPAINMPGMYGADETDTFYRTVAGWSLHFDLGIKLAEQYGWKTFGLIRFDGPAGDELGLGVRMKIGEIQDASLAFDLAIARESFDLETYRDDLDQIIQQSMNDLDTTVIVVLQTQAVEVIDYLITNGYHSDLSLTSASISAEMFGRVNGLEDWLDLGLSMIGVEPDNYQGQNSQSFSSAYRDRYGQDPGANSAPAYDCAAALLLSLLYAGEDQASPAAIQKNMRRFKEENRTTDEVPVGIGTDGFTQAAEAIRAGQSVAFEGASGNLLFDQNGDRPRQGLRVVEPDPAVGEWVVVERYDADLNLLD